jgi:hypothetical protein
MSESTIADAIKVEEKMIAYWQDKQSAYVQQKDKDVCAKNIKWGMEEIANLKIRKMRNAIKENL